MKKALRKSSNTSEDESHMGDDGDETDTEQHEQLPHDQDTTADKRTPTKRKKTVDDRKAEQPSQSQSEPPKQHHQHRHHHHRQQLPRKLSFMQLREIAETTHHKSEQTSDEVKPIESVSAIVDLKAKEKCIRAGENPHTQADEHNKVNVVSERRALRRQQNARESEGSLSLQMSFPDAIDIVNEKPKPIEKPPRTKSPQKGNNPEIFKLNMQSMSANDAPEHSSNKENDEIAKDHKDILISSTKNKSPKKEHLDSQSKNPSPTPSFHLVDSSKEIEIIVSSSASTPLKSSNESRKHLSQSSTPQQSPSPSEKVSKHGSDDILNKPIRKLNSFLALVKEAVHSKKPDPQHQQQQPSPQKQQQQPPPPQQESQIDVSPPHDLVSRVKLFIDDSNSVSMTESIKTTTESVTSSKMTCYESLRRLRHSDQPKSKHQDSLSQASIWSEIIPVITISKSESNECILERDNDDVELSDSKK